MEKLTGMPQLKVSYRPSGCCSRWFDAGRRYSRHPRRTCRTTRIRGLGRTTSVRPDCPDFRTNTGTVRRRSARLLVDGHDGSRIPLSQFATIEQTFGPGTIRREAGSRRIAVEAAVDGSDLGSAAAGNQYKAQAVNCTLPTGYFFNVGGRVESQSRAARSLRIAIGCRYSGGIPAAVSRIGFSCGRNRYSGDLANCVGGRNCGVADRR